MPKQTSSRPSKKPEPYPSPKPKRPTESPPANRKSTASTAMSTGPATMSTMIQQTPNMWQPTTAPEHHMPPPAPTYSQRLSMMERSHQSYTSTSHAAASHISNTSSPWSAQDDEILLAARAQSHGWNKIQHDHFPTKSSNACRKRYERLAAKRRGIDWNDERVDRVAAHYMHLREQTWRPLADAVGEDWRDVEKLCLERGARTLLPNLEQHHLARVPSQSRRGSHDSHDEERLSIHNLLQ